MAGHAFRLSRLRLLRQGVGGRFVYRVVPDWLKVAQLPPSTSSLLGIRGLSVGRRVFQSDSSDRVLLEECSLKVPSFGGSLWVNSPFNVVVKPVGTTEYPHLDRAFVKVYGGSRDLKGFAKMDVKQEGHKLSLNASPADNENINFEEPPNITGEISVPVVHNVNVNVQGFAEITVKNMVESNYTHLTGANGDIQVDNVKTANLIVQTERGDVLCNGSIQGSVSILTGSGNVVSNKRFVGPTLDVTTDNGDIRVASSYSDQSKFSTNSGNLYLRNIHNESYVAVYEQGSVTMLGVDGSTNVFVKKGDIDIQVSKVKHESRIHVEEGDITLKISDNYPVKVSVNASEIIPDTKFNSYGTVTRTKDENYQHYYGIIQQEKFSPTLEVIAENGRVVIESQDWAASVLTGLRSIIDNPDNNN